MESGEGNVLIDPLFSPNVAFFKRLGSLGFDPSKMPQLGAVLITHSHIDHLDFASFNYIKTGVPVVVPEGSARVIQKALPNPVIELSEWASHNFKGITVNAVPARHSRYNLIPYFYKKALGYVVELGSKKILFAGDTAYDSHFKDIAHAHSVDIALLPIGGYSPRFIMKYFHMDPVETLQAFTDLNAKIMVPIHWGTFRLSFERPDQPLKGLTEDAAKRNLTEKIKILQPGESYDF